MSSALRRIVFAFCLAPAFVTAQHLAPKRVLALTPLSPLRPAIVSILLGMQRTFNQGMHSQIELVQEHATEEADAEWLLAKYRDTRFDLVVTLNRPPIAAALEFRRRTDPSIPMVMAINPSSPQPRGVMDSRVVRHEVDLGTFRTIETALAVLPGTENLAFVGGSTATDRLANQLWMEEIRKRWPKLTLLDLTGLSLQTLRQRMSHLPGRTVGFLGNFDEDAGGLNLSKRELIAELGPTANAPIFDDLDVSFGLGSVGGWMSSADAIGVGVAKAGLRLLQGEPPESIGVVHDVPGSYRFDSRQLKRWGIDPSRLPAGSSIEYVEPSIWERYRNGLLFAMGVAVALLGLVLYLMVDRWRRERAHSEFRERTGFDALLGQTVLALHKRSEAQKDESMQAMLGNLRHHLQADAIALTVSRTEEQQVVLQGFYSPGVLPPPEPQDFPFISAELQAGRDLRIANLRELPAAAAVDKANLEKRGVQSFFAARLGIVGELTGAFVVGNRVPREWPEELVQKVRQMGETAIEAWGHRLAAGESLSQTILQSFEGYVLALDRDGNVLQANSSPLAVEHGAGGLRPARPGKPYREIWKDGPPASVLESVRQVLVGERPEAEVEVRYEAGGAERWLQVQVSPLRHANGGAVAMHVDTTERKRAEQAGAHQLNQIAHWNRVSALGELASSLAHEVNQPLSAILANTEVARALLEMEHPDLREVREIIDDVQSDGRRAKSVIGEMRGLLKKNQAPLREPLNVAEVVRETLRLVLSDAARRRVRVEAEGCNDVGLAAIDRTQLQQVVLNLLSNALDAAEAAPEDQRWIRVQTLRSDAEVRIEVADSGPGVAFEPPTRAFEPFVTTKPDGLGVGLAISLSIVTAAGGGIAVDRGEGGGAVFRVALPLAD